MLEILQSTVHGRNKSGQSKKGKLSLPGQVRYLRVNFTPRRMDASTFSIVKDKSSSYIWSTELGAK